MRCVRGCLKKTEEDPSSLRQWHCVPLSTLHRDDNVEKFRRGFRDGGEKGSRVGMLRSSQDFVDGTGLDEASGLHDGNGGSELRDNGKTVRDEDQREREFALQAREQFEDLRADGNVERGNRLVGDDDFGAQDQSAGNADALALSSGKFVRIAADKFFTAEADGVKDFGDALAAVIAREFRFVNFERLGRRSRRLSCVDSAKRRGPEKPFACGGAGIAVRSRERAANSRCETKFRRSQAR